MKFHIANSALKPGFTLVELMISVALVVILMLGITKVFTLTSDTAGATNQLSSSLRDGRAAQTVFSQDFTSAVTDDAPCMLLDSSRLSAFRNAADQKSDLDGNPLTVDLNGNNIEGENAGSISENISPATYNYRSHRVDTFSFFSRQLLQRQTGGSIANTATPLMSQMSSNEAWIWYGHLEIPDNQQIAAGQQPNFVDLGPGPGGSLTVANNPNNFFASQWILGREAILLRQKDSANNISDNHGVSQAYIDNGTVASQGYTKLSPLYYFSSSPTSVSPRNLMFQSRYDLAATSIDDFSSRMSSYLNGTTMSWAQANNPSSTTVNWWGEMFCGGKQPRFQANPFTSSPLTATNFAQHAPIFLQGCTQFIVEYAGDFVAQDPTTGQITNVYTNTNGTDGQVDFVITKDANGNLSKKIRWYGLPRDVDGIGGTSPNQFNTGAPDGAIPVFKTGATAAQENLMADVVPLRDVWRLSQIQGVGAYVDHAPFEKFTWTADPQNSDVPAPSPAFPTYHTSPLLTDVSATSGDYMAAGLSGMQPNDSYICAWGPNDPKPKMIRIIVTLDDPNGKTPDGQTFEYVFTLP